MGSLLFMSLTGLEGCQSCSSLVLGIAVILPGLTAGMLATLFLTIGSKARETWQVQKICGTNAGAGQGRAAEGAKPQVKVTAISMACGTIKSRLTAHLCAC